MGLRCRIAVNMAEKGSMRSNISLFEPDVSQKISDLTTSEITRWVSDDNLDFLSVVHELWRTGKNKTIYDLSAQLKDDYTVDEIGETLYRIDMAELVADLLDMGEDQLVCTDFVREAIGIVEKSLQNYAFDMPIDKVSKERINLIAEGMVLKAVLINKGRYAEDN